MQEYTPRYVKMKPMKQLIREKLISVLHVSDDGEFVRYKINPGPEVGEWAQFDQVLMVVDRDTVHKNKVTMAPQLYEGIDSPVPPLSAVIADRDHHI